MARFEDQTTPGNYHYCCHCSAPIRPRDARCWRCGNAVIIDRRYRLLRRIGSGGFGVVFEARHVHKRYRCAIKRMPVTADDPDTISRITNEIVLLQDRLNDLPCVPAIYDYVAADGFVYLIMEYIDGLPLDQWPHEYWHPARVRRFLEIMLSQLVQIHARGVIHRDIKPANIIRTFEHDYVLIDFGIAKPSEALRTLMHHAGTPAYMPIEQIIGQPTTVRSDLYSLAATAYHLLTGYPPPAADHRRLDLSLPPSSLRLAVPPDLEETLTEMLAIYPEDRPYDAAAALKLLRRKRKPLPLPPDSAGEFTLFMHRLAQIALALVIVLSLLLGALVFLSQRSASADLPAIAGLLAFSTVKDGAYDREVTKTLTK